MKRYAVARLLGVHGLQGELKCETTPLGEHSVRRGVYRLGEGDDAPEIRVRSVREQGERLLVAFEGYPDATAAQALSGSALYLERERIVLLPGEYVIDDLIGLQLVDRNSPGGGTVRAVRHYPAHDCLVVDPGEALVPLVGAFEPEVDLEKRTIVMSLPAGLL